jgi:hypothetical protein
MGIYLWLFLCLGVVNADRKITMTCETCSQPDFGSNYVRLGEGKGSKEVIIPEEKACS